MNTTINELISQVAAGTLTATDAAAQCHPYALEYYRPASRDEWAVLQAIRKSAKSTPLDRERTVVSRAIPVLQLRCRQCGEHGVAGQHPFSTAAHTGLCDDCGA